MFVLYLLKILQEVDWRTVATSTVIVALIGAAATIVVKLIDRRPNKIQRRKAEVENEQDIVKKELLYADLYDRMKQSLMGDIGRLEEKIGINIRKINSLQHDKNKHEKAILALQKQNRECEYQHKVAKLEMISIKKRVDHSSWYRHPVYVLDDDETVIEQFAQKFAGISVLQFNGCRVPEQFIAEVNEAKPPVVVVDMRLGHGLTALDIRARLTFKPKCFIMSGEKHFENQFKDQDVRFIVKDYDNFYILQIAEETIEYLNTL